MYGALYNDPMSVLLKCAGHAESAKEKKIQKVHVEELGHAILPEEKYGGYTTTHSGIRSM